MATAWIAGGSAMAYGASNLVEAGQDIYYGSIGDPYTVAFNPIRDTVFCGNQGLYDLWGGVATDVAGMLIPIGIASKAAKAAEIGTKTADIGSKAAKAAEIASKTKKIQTAVSGVHGAISAGFGNVKQQFYEKGSLEAIDWGEVAGKSTVGGITGTATAYGGAKLSEGLTAKLSQNAFVDSLLHSDSAAKRVAMNMAVSSTSEVGTGMGTRFLGGFLTTGGNVKEAWAQAINPQSILFDATLGASMGGVKGLQKPQQSYADLMSPEDAVKYRQFLEHGSTAGFTSPELKAFDKVDETLLMNRIDYDEVLAARKSAIPNSERTVSGVQEINKPRQYSGDLMPPEDAAKWNQWNKFRENGLDINVENDILLTNKGLRPDPSTYLSDKYIKEHLAQFDDGVSVIQTEWAFSRYSETNGFVGVPDDNTLFVMPKEFCDEVLKKANGNLSIIESELGFPKDYFKKGGGLVRIDIEDTIGLDVRIPSGNETGANDLWIPGGYTSGGVPEAVTNTIPLDNTQITKLN